MPGRAIFLGRVPDTTDVYAASDLFVLPSHLEGFGLVFIEAAFHGVPSIGTNVGGVPYAIEDGKTGMLVPVKDDAAFAASIKKLWDHAALRQQMGEAARARACSEFTEARMAERYAAILTGKPSV
jgi:glycosyltransferase involved in cell wall biosynthesis